MNKKLKFLHTPPGSKPFYKEEALFRSAIEKRLTSFFEKWNFIPIETPLIDYFDVYSDILSDDIKKGSVKFIDKDGEVILLRNDITLFAAKLVASRISLDATTLKYFYSDSIVRKESSGIPEEYYQIGCEIVDENFKFQELEILTILLESLKELEIKDTKLHIGDISFYQNLLDTLKKDQLEEILGFIRLRNKKSLLQKLDELKLPSDIKDDCLMASNFIGTLDELQGIKFSKKGERSLSWIKNIVTILCELGYQQDIIIDLSELATLNYYNGIVFHLYSDKVESPIVSGGRYDILFEKLGLKKSAVGFSYWLYPLEKLLNTNYIKKNGVIDVRLNSDVVTNLKRAIKHIRDNDKINIVH